MQFSVYPKTQKSEEDKLKKLDKPFEKSCFSFETVVVNGKRQVRYRDLKTVRFIKKR
jgi:hypothetical protein